MNGAVQPLHFCITTKIEKVSKRNKILFVFLLFYKNRYITLCVNKNVLAVMKQDETMTTFDVIIVGGGATGAGTARDCARRGLHVLLLERSDIATGATGRNHGLFA